MFPESSNSTQKSEPTQSYPQNGKSSPGPFAMLTKPLLRQTWLQTLKGVRAPRSAKTLTSSNIALQRLAFTSRAALVYSLKMLNKIAETTGQNIAREKHSTS